MSWTADRVESLKQYVAEGRTASQIARLIGGVSRNAVIGKVHRSGLCLSTPPSWSNKGDRPVRKAKPKAPKPRVHNPLGAKSGRTKAKPLPPKPFKPVVVELAAPTCEPVTLIERTDTQCPWIAGETHGPATLMCGEAKDI
ncbi:MAG: GcrA cell cycle regulator, partial [Bradyrhizobium sp.]|nr:GcrA cell cycle regulator [Bradyrhizobium sp.]